MDSTETTEQVLFSDDDLAAINAARTILERVSDAAIRSSWNERNLDAANYGRVSALAGAAADSLFDVLNTTNAHNVQSLTDAILYNKVEV